MIDDLRAMAVFARTVEYGSFRRAARELQLSPSVVSHHISQLEKRLGVALLYRSTRQLTLTDPGQRLFISSKQMLEAAQSGLNDLQVSQEEVSGTLKLTLPFMLARHSITGYIAAFASQYPKVSLNLNYSDHPQNLIKEGIDLAVRIGPLKDSSLKSKKLFDMTRVLVASEKYIDSRASPKQPEDLNDWEWIGLATRSGKKELQHPKKKKPVNIDITPRITADSMDAVYQLCLSGLGLCTPPEFMVKQALGQGVLKTVLAPWHPTSLGVYAVWPPNAGYNQLVTSLIRFLSDQQHLSSYECQD
ncbi:LysR family transcriptional regulator [Hahella ganghwensis]|uniref:LysR family transcriptional regulator n=1 Tax=Hahella ganghwensis TaxID=286420 RepID=UPI00036C2DE9|nr:LysR family transcriptional regulator [Hahella ganghwensis]